MREQDGGTWLFWQLILFPGIANQWPANASGHRDVLPSKFGPSSMLIAVSFSDEKIYLKHEIIYNRTIS